MFKLSNQLSFQITALATLAVAALAAAPSPVAAASQCNSSEVQVEFVGVGASNTTLVQGVDGYFVGNVLVRVFCQLDNSPVTGSVINVWTTVKGSAILDTSSSSWTNATDSNHPVTIAVPTGDQQVTIRTLDPGLAGWKAKVGTDTVTVSQIFGQPVNPGDILPAPSNIWAQTPELDSLPLFAAGGFGLVGYALLRRRAHISPK